MDQAYSKRTEEGLSLDLREMIWRLLEQWKAIVVFVLIVMLLFSGLMYVSASGNSQSSSEEPSANQSQEEVLRSLGSADREMVEVLFDMYISKLNLIDYVNSAPVMSLDPYDVNRLTMSWYIEADPDVESELATAYRENTMSDEAASEIQKVWGDSFTYNQIKEMVYAGNITNFYDDINRDIDVVKINVFLPDGIDASATEKALNNIIDASHQTLADSIAEHNIALIGSETARVSDNDLANFQTNVYTRLYTVNYQINNMKALLSDGQKTAFEKLVSLKSAEEGGGTVETTSNTVAKTPLFSKRNLAIGFILGCFLYGCVFILKFILSGKIQSPMAYERFYGIMTLGEWHSDENKKGILGSLLRDKAVFRRHHKGHTEIGKEADKACKTILAASEVSGYNKLLLISGDESGENVKAFEEEIRRELAENGIQTDVSTTDVRNGRPMEDEKLPQNDGALLMVDRNCMSMKDIKDVLDKCAYFNTPLIGAVYVE